MVQGYHISCAEQKILNCISIKFRIILKYVLVIIDSIHNEERLMSAVGLVYSSLKCKKERT